MRQMAGYCKSGEYCGMNYETKIFNTMEEQQATEKTAQVQIQCSFTYKAEVHESYAFKRVKEKAWKKKF